MFDPDKKMHTTLGTAYYIAPEVLNKMYNEKCDIWSLGVILYILLCGSPPFNGQTDEQIFRKVRQGSYSFANKAWSTRSQESMDLINKMLVVDPNKRISAAQALQHPWIKKAAHEKINSTETELALSNLKNFRADQKMQQAALTFIVS